jgi:indole-3-glycerol phosphate synthase
MSPAGEFLAVMGRASRERAREARARRPEAELARAAAASPTPPRVCLSPEGFDLVAEIKFRSPAEGPLADPAAAHGPGDRALAYAAGGAALVSVLTEPERFAGDLSHLAAVAAAGVPALRKDFLVDPYQVMEARAAGAAAVLLIVRLLGEVGLSEMLAAAGELGLAVLLESFDEADLARAIPHADAGGDGRPPVWLGVNARDLATLQVDGGRMARFASLLPPGAVTVAESGVALPGDAAAIAAAGYRAALVGSALMRSAYPEGLVRALLRAGRDARGPVGRGARRLPIEERTP